MGIRSNYLQKCLILCLVTGSVIIAGCAKSGPEEMQDNDHKGAYRTEFRFSSAKKVFGFSSSAQYSYCPTVIDNGDGCCHIWFCGNPTRYQFVDNIYHLYAQDGFTYVDAKSVLQPTPGSWDSYHCCDPSVIRGEFKMDGKTYSYAMFYLGIDTGDCKGNEIGVAFSDDPNSSSWVKYPKVLIDFPGDEHSKYWGVGQPSAISLDKKGRVLLTYTRGASSGTSILFREIDMSDMSNITLGEARTVPGAVGVSFMRNADFAVDRANNKILAVIEGPSPSSYPTFISSSVSVFYAEFDEFKAGRCTWKSYGSITSAVSGFARNHNACLRRDAFGYIPDYKDFTVYFTVSKAAPDVSPSNCAEWTYNIYKVVGSYEKIYLDN